MKERNIFAVIGLFLLAWGIVGWRQEQNPLSERTDLPNYTTSYIVKGKHKWAAVSKQPTVPTEGANVVTVYDGDDGDYRIVAVEGDKEWFVHKNK